jgi:hypothetical protein
MPPRKRDEPKLSGWQGLIRNLLQLRLKISSLKSGPSAKAIQECVRAAGVLETTLTTLELGAPALQEVLEQVRGERCCGEPRGG